MAKKNSQKLVAEDRDLKRFSSILTTKGISIRREKLVSGSSFRVKSGHCKLSGDNFLFLDNRLPSSQQLSILTDFATERAIRFKENELEGLSETLIQSCEKLGLIE